MKRPDIDKIEKRARRFVGAQKYGYTAPGILIRIELIEYIRRLELALEAQTE